MSLLDTDIKKFSAKHVSIERGQLVFTHCPVIHFAFSRGNGSDLFLNLVLDVSSDYSNRQFAVNHLHHSITFIDGGKTVHLMVNFNDARVICHRPDSYIVLRKRLTYPSKELPVLITVPRVLYFSCSPIQHGTRSRTVPSEAQCRPASPLPSPPQVPPNTD